MVKPQANLLQIIEAFDQVSAFANLVNRGKQQPDQNCDNSDYDKSFQQR
jgi:hypothetical protein